MDGVMYEPVSMERQRRTSSGSTRECQDRCRKVSGCAHFSRWNADGGCHLQDRSARPVWSPGVMAGPQYCSELSRKEADAILQEAQQAAEAKKAAALSRKCPAGDRSPIFDSAHPEDDFFNDLLTNPAYAQYQPSAVSRDPWILQFDSFLTSAESDLVIEGCEYFNPDITGGGDTQSLNSLYRNSS